MTKRDVLLAICETPGWRPPPEISDGCLNWLLSNGLIIRRGPDGYEASSLALDHYPSFAPWPEIVDQAPQPEVREWSEMTLPSFHLRGLQRAEAKIEHGRIGGAVILVNEAATKGLTEVEVIIRTRTISDR